MKWIKASEAMPGKEDAYYVKLNGVRKALMYFNGKRFETYQWITNKDIEWLDENDYKQPEVVWGEPLREANKLSDDNTFDENGEDKVFGLNPL